MRGLYPDAVGTDVIEHHTLGLAQLADSVDPSLAVPTCPGWTMADLVWHLTEVQAFWTHIISRRPEGPETFEPPIRPADDRLAEGLRQACRGVLIALSGAAPDETAWSWSDDHSVGFTLRRQSHESLIHHLDGLATAKRPAPPVPGALAADGIDELVDVIVCGVPPWATFTPSIEVVRLVTTDTGDAWTFGLGTLSGTSTQSGLTYDGSPAANRLDDSVGADVTIRGRSIDVLTWLWGRGGMDRLGLDGEVGLADGVRRLVVANTQ